MPVDADALERLRRLRALGVQRGLRDLVPPPAREPAGQGLPGEEVDTPYGPAWVCTTLYPLAQQPDLAGFLRLKPTAIAALGRHGELAALEPRRAAFVDTETTGLSLGTDTYTFLIGIGTFGTGDGPSPAETPAGHFGEASHFAVHQVLMRNPAEERAQLHLVEDILRRCTGIVSFNGRSFDLPLLENRFVLARMPLPFAGAPHLDLLPPARRIWHSRWGSCALGRLEQNVLGVQRTGDDVPGWMIPSIYRDYYRTGNNTETMARVFYHNREDIKSMALLAARMGPLFDAAQVHGALEQLHPLECASLAHCYEALEWIDLGEAAYRRALASLSPGLSWAGRPGQDRTVQPVLGELADADRMQVLRDFSLMLKRLGRRSEAAALWEEWIGTVPGTEVTPYVELAKYHEWHTGDFAAARGWIAWAVHVVERDPAQAAQPHLVADLKHRLGRIERKLNGETAPGGGPAEE